MKFMSHQRLSGFLTLTLFATLLVVSPYGFASNNRPNTRQSRAAQHRTKRNRRHRRHIRRKVTAESSSSPTTAEAENLKLQRERLEFDKEKANLDNNRAERAITLERNKAILSAFATAVPLAAAALAIVFGFLSQKKQAKHQSDLNEAQARHQFELKAAEIIFAGNTPQAMIRRGKALKKI